MKLSQIKHALNESKKMIREAEEEFGGDNFDQFLASIKEIEKHARERRVLEPDYSKEDLLADIKREIPDIDDKVVNKMADFVFGHLGESTQVTEAQTAEELEVGEPVKITGNVQFQGATGVIDSFGTGKRFVIVDLGEQGLRSFHSSDVSFNAEEEQDEFEGVEESTNPQDTITMDVPLFIRTLEFAREDAKDDMDLHDAAENALKLSANGDTLTMDNYDAIVPSDAVEEAGPGFVDVTGWSARDVQRLGHEDDDYEEPRRNHGYGYNRPAAKPVLSGYYFYNVSPADENDATAIGLKKTKSGKWALAVYNTSGRSTTMKKQSADRAFGPGRWWAPKTESVEQGVAEAMSPQQQHDFDRMRAGAMSRQEYDAKWRKKRKSDDEVIYGKRKGVAEGSDNIRSMIQQYEDMVELVYDLPPGRKKNIAIDKRDALEAQIEAMPGGSEALRKWARAYNDSFDEGVAEGGPFSYGAKKPRRGSVADLAAKKRKEQDKNYKPTEPKDQMVGTAKVTKGVAESYTGRETKDGTWRVFKDGKAVAVAGPFKSREEVSAWIKKQKQGVAEGTESSIEKKIQAKQDSLSLAREQRRARGQRQQGPREIKLQAEIDKLNTELTQLKKKGVAEGEQQVYKVVALDKGNALKKPTKMKVKADSIEDLFGRLSANDWYPLEINGVEVIAGKRLKQGVAEAEDPKKDVEAIRAAIARMEREIADPNPHIDREKLRQRIAWEKRRLNLYRDVEGVAEGLPQTLRKIVPGYAKREIDRKMDAQKFGRTDVDKDANFHRYKKIQDKIKEQGVAEGRLHNPGQEDSPVAQAIIRRVLLQRTDLLAKYGPGFVGQAIDDVADSVGAVDEIGSSDVSGWVKQVEWNLKNKLNQYDEPMNMDEASDISGILGAASMVKDYIITAEVDGTTKKFRIRGMTGPRAAKERFLKHAAYAKVLDVKPVEEQKMNEVTLGDYRKKAAMQKAQSQMGAMFARSPEEREKNTATFYKRERGLNRLKARDEAARKAEQERQLADTIARLPELKAEYERMRAEYKSLGGSDWQYADREQNLTDSERKARAMEGPMNNLWRQINAAEKAQGSK